MKETLIDAQNKDDLDFFKARPDLFDLPKNKIYLNGNSLGPSPKTISDALKQECEAWGRLGVRGHFDQERPWISYHTQVATSLARLVGAQVNEVVVMGTLTSNLHFAFVSFYKPKPTRYKIIRLSGFPSDTYAIDSQIKQRFTTLQDFNVAFKWDDAIIELKPDAQGYIPFAAFKQALETHGHETAIIWIEAIHFLTGQYFDIAAITQLAHQYGCKIGVDLAHAIGNVPLKLHEWKVDFAVWCSYKYLSAGPGGIAGLYIHEKYLTDPTVFRFSGWWGHNQQTRFQMPAVFDPIPTAESWQVSNPGIFLITCLRAALDIFDQVDLKLLHEKNKRLVAYLEGLLLDEFNDLAIITPQNPNERGCQLSLRIERLQQKSDIEKTFYNEGIICDVRNDLIRVAPMGLYSTFSDVFLFVEKLKMISALFHI